MRISGISATRKRTPDDPSALSIAGVVLSLRQHFLNTDGSFTLIAELADGTTVRGRIEAKSDVKPGCKYRFLGRWQEHHAYGWQFAFDLFIAECPDDPDGIAAYLAKHADRVGPVAAARLVAAYGKDAVRVLCDTPERAVSDGLIKLHDAGLASESLKKVYVDPLIRDAHVELSGITRGLGFPSKLLSAALKKWKTRAPAMVRRDPFLLMTSGLPGASFLRCDRLYTSLGLPQGRLKRQALAAWYALDQLSGDTWTSASRALTSVRDQIGGTAPRERRAVAVLCRASLAECRTDAHGQVWVAERQKAVDERAVAHAIRRLSAEPARWPDLSEIGLDPTRDQHQIQALAGITGAVSLLTGGAGTGKTHVAALVIRALTKQVGAAKVAVCAPTGKAAVRIAQKLNEAGIKLETSTIHKLLAVRGTEEDGEGYAFGYRENSPLPHRYIVVDEVSMVDTSLAASLFRACATGTHLLLIGDPYQLPPVGHGAFLRDLIAAGLPRAHLSETRRNSGLIVDVAHAIARGELPQLPQDLGEFPIQNLIHLGVAGEDKGQAIRDKIDVIYDRLNNGCANHLNLQRKYDPIEDVQVVVARNTTRQALNLHLQERLNPGPKDGKYRPNDKVICLKNGVLMDPKRQRVFVANGDIGRVVEAKDTVMRVILQCPQREVIVPLLGAKKLEQLARTNEDSIATSWDLAYAVTCHKYQGSEVPVAVVVVDGAGRLGSREWLYTAVTRGRKLTVAVGSRQEIRRCVDRVELPDRKTFLVEGLR